MLRHLSRRAVHAQTSGSAVAGPSRAAAPVASRRAQLFGSSRQASTAKASPSSSAIAAAESSSSSIVDAASALNAAAAAVPSSSHSIPPSIRNQRTSVTRSQPTSSFSTTSQALREAASSDAHAKRIASNPTSHVTPSSKPHIPSASSTASLLQVTTLPNGVRVATDGTPGHFVAAGIYVGAGSRYEWEGNSGSSHMIDRLAFKSTTNRTGEEMTREIEALGGQFLASSSREVIMYQASSYTHCLPEVVSLLSDTVLNPVVTDEEIDLQRESVQYELAEINNKPEMILPEILYEVAFQGNTLGHPLLIPEDRLAKIDAECIRKYRKEWFRPDRMVVAGAGVPHQELLALAEKHFGHLENPSLPRSTSASTSSSNASRNVPPHLLHSSTQASETSSRASGKASYATSAMDSIFSSLTSKSGDLPSALEPTYEELANARPKYTAGAYYDTSRTDLEFSHLYIAYEGLSIHDPDVYTLATLQMLLGGGSSFSAGGPGKGMYSRLYTQVLNRYHEVEHASAFHHCYNDTGLFAMYIATSPNLIGKAPMIVADQLQALMDTSNRRGVNYGELNRAKNQLKSSLVMALESRMVQVEDLGRQVLAHNSKVPIEEMLSKIDQVSLPDLQRVARRIFRPKQYALESPIQGEVRSGEPTILAAGRLDGLGDAREILRQAGLAP
ncbi:LuxS/MPP-like metallohydrolase [Cystobasidium minutum MCA 4210]|uniref:LuxS/MPP-like metallohydrolase n=1 Tax=Cystobasidium minutum MCA 4210 TaxID=1397322 RepID=UPI0034CFE6AE|eukprot:jgi/Rhomi1/208327/estExt_Genemark1.C_1_t30374